MNAQAAAAKERRGSVLRRFNLALLLLYVLSVLISGAAVWSLTKQQVYAQANKELTLLVDMVKSIQGYVAGDLRPWFLKNNQFYTRAISGIVATARVADHFKKLQPGYYIKNASDNPINAVNLPEPMEASLLQRFRGDHSLESLVETGEIQGRNFLVASAPKVSKQGCLRCHGDPEKAPKDQQELYGTGTGGYNYIPDDVVGVSVVGVPLADVNAIATQRSLVVIGLLTGLFAIIFIMVNILVRRYLLSDIFQITRTAQAVSQGDVNRSMVIDRNDEIGELAHSFELMRRSLVAAMQRLQRK